MRETRESMLWACFDDNDDELLQPKHSYYPHIYTHGQPDLMDVILK